MSFSPSDREWVVKLYDAKNVADDVLPVIGFATVVIERSTWVVTTEVQVVVICCGRPRPMNRHADVDESHNHYPLRWEVERA